MEYKQASKTKIVILLSGVAALLGSAAWVYKSNFTTLPDQSDLNLAVLTNLEGTAKVDVTDLRTALDLEKVDAYIYAGKGVCRKSKVFGAKDQLKKDDKCYS